MQRNKKVCAIIVQVFIIRVRNVPRLSDTFSGALHEANANDMTRFPQNGGHWDN